MKPKLARVTRLGTYIDLPNLVEIGSLKELHNGVTYNTFVPFKTFPFLSFPFLSFPSLPYFILAHLHSLNELTDFNA